MKIQILSDLHQEWERYDYTTLEHVDVLILCGDIDANKHVNNILPFMIKCKRCYLVPGNHDHWGKALDLVDSCRYWKVIEEAVNKMAEILQFPGRLKIFTHFDVEYFEGILFAGCTLWTNIPPGLEPVLMEACSHDFEQIMGFTIRDWIEENASDTDDLTQFLKATNARGVKRVVMTHYLPSPICISERFKGQADNVGWACTNLDNLIGFEGPDLWFYGHSHSSSNILLGETRLICNPKGYSGTGDDGTAHIPNPDFDPKLIIEI